MRLRLEPEDDLLHLRPRSGPGGWVRVGNRPNEGYAETAFEQHPRVPCTLDLTHRNVGRVCGGEPEWEEGDDRPEVDPETSFARGHRASTWPGPARRRWGTSASS